MKDIFDNCNLGNLELNSRIIRTGIWESQNDNNRLTKEVYDRYDIIASSGVGMITSEIISYILRTNSMIILIKYMMQILCTISGN